MGTRGRKPNQHTIFCGLCHREIVVEKPIECGDRELPNLMEHLKQEHAPNDAKALRMIGLLERLKG